jgi:hypothetical protein
MELRDNSPYNIMKPCCVFKAVAFYYFFAESGMGKMQKLK